jgi:hypothetical protein
MGLEAEAQPLLVHRREFLVWSAVGALLPWVEGVARAAQVVKPQPAARIEALSIGYVEGSNDFPRLDRLPWDSAGAQKLNSAPALAVLSAAAMPVGDQRFAGHASARVTIHGLYPAAAAASRGIDSVDLDVLFPSPDPSSEAPLPFFAWSFRRRPGFSPSPPIAFNVPLGLDGQLDFALRTVYRGEGSGLARRALAGSTAVERRFRGSFTVDANQGQPKLQRGIYLLGLRPSVWDADTSLPSGADRQRATDLCSVAVSVEAVAEA